jgi:hypothetical protein
MGIFSMTEISFQPRIAWNYAKTWLLFDIIVVSGQP